MVAQVIDTHASAAAGRVDEMIVAKIDADMRKLAVQGVEKHQIAGTQFIVVERLAEVTHADTAARQFDAEGVVIYMRDESAAIEAAVGIVAAVAIRYTHQALCIVGQVGDGGVTGRARACHAGTGCG